MHSRRRGKVGIKEKTASLLHPVEAFRTTEEEEKKKKQRQTSGRTSTKVALSWSSPTRGFFGWALDQWQKGQ